MLKIASLAEDGALSSMFFSHGGEKKHETKQEQMGQRKGKMAVNAKKEKTINALVFVKEKNYKRCERVLEK